MVKIPLDLVKAGIVLQEYQYICRGLSIKEDAFQSLKTSIYNETVPTLRKNKGATVKIVLIMK